MGHASFMKTRFCDTVSSPTPAPRHNVTNRRHGVTGNGAESGKTGLAELPSEYRMRSLGLNSDDLTI